MNNKIKPLNIVSWCILSIVFLLMIVPLSSILIQKHIKKLPVPMFLGYAYMKVNTGSMNGTINEGDMIIVKKTNDYSLGDVVTYIEENGKVAVTHRIVNYGPQDGMYITKGDANLSEDVLPITSEQIVGKVIYVIPKVGLFCDWFIHEGGFIYALAMITVVVAGVYLWKFTNPKSDTNIA